MRDASDAICRRYGLSIEDSPRIDQDRRKNYRELKDEREFRPTLRSKVRADIDAAISCSLTLKEFGSVMSDMGYKFILESETGKELKYPKLKLPGSDKCVRLKTLGPGYGVDDYHERIIRNAWESAKQKDPFSNLEDIKTLETLDRYSARLNRAGYRVVITYHNIQLRSCKRRRKYREYSPALIEDIRKLDKYIRLQDFCRRYRLDTPCQAEQLRSEIKEKISHIAEEREECRKTQKHWERHGVPAYANLWRQAVKEKTKALRELYKEVHLCEELMNTEPVIRAQSINLVQQRIREEEKRLLQKEHTKTRPNPYVR